MSGRLSAEDVAAIRAARSGARPTKLILLARRFGISEGYVSLIAAGRRPCVKPAPLRPADPTV